MSDKPLLGLVGLGIMGAPIALNLAARGYRVTAWNLEPDRYEMVREGGVEWAGSPAEVWSRCDVGLVCVLGDDALEAVVLGAGGFASGKGSARLVIDLSTSSPAATRDIAERFKRQTGADWLDAPMSGGPQPAREGDLALMVGGDRAHFERAEPLLRDIGSNVTYMGPLGSGQKTKILNQAIVGVNYILMAELLATAKAADIDPKLLPVCLKGGLADSAILQRIYTQMMDDDFDPPRSYARQVNKDLKSVHKFLAELDLDMPVIELAVARYAEFTEDGNEMADSASVSRLYRKG
jgi:3-hydroxyisobutyrate dehydrogenase